MIYENCIEVPLIPTNLGFIRHHNYLPRKSSASHHEQVTTEQESLDQKVSEPLYFSRLPLPNILGCNKTTH